MSDTVPSFVRKVWALAFKVLQRKQQQQQQQQQQLVAKTLKFNVCRKLEFLASK